jgi:hypothetical protein
MIGGLLAPVTQQPRRNPHDMPNPSKVSATPHRNGCGKAISRSGDFARVVRSFLMAFSTYKVEFSAACKGSSRVLHRLPSTYNQFIESSSPSSLLKMVTKQDYSEHRTMGEVFFELFLTVQEINAKGQELILDSCQQCVEVLSGLRATNPFCNTPPQSRRAYLARV